MTLRVEAVEIAGFRLPCCGTVLDHHGWVVLLFFKGSSFTYTPRGRSVSCHNCGKTSWLPTIYGNDEVARRNGGAIAMCLKLGGEYRFSGETVLTWRRENLLLPEPAVTS